MERPLLSETIKETPCQSSSYGNISKQWRLDNKRQISLLINNPVSGDAYRLVQICKMNQINEANTRNDEPDSLLMSDYDSGNEMEDVRVKMTMA